MLPDAAALVRRAAAVAGDALIGVVLHGSWARGEAARTSDVDVLIVVVDPPRIHDVGDVLIAERARLPAAIAPEAERLAEASRGLRRDRELAFYGAEDLTPSDLYHRRDRRVGPGGRSSGGPAGDDRTSSRRPPHP